MSPQSKAALKHMYATLAAFKLAVKHKDNIDF